MKKCISILLAVSIVILMLMVSGCSAAGNEQSESDTATNSVSEQSNSDVQSVDETVSASSTESAQENTASGSKALVVYFSRTGEQYGVGVIDEGNTAIVAKMIAEETSADTFEILPVDDHYPMTYDALTDVAKQEQNENARPEYQGGVPELSQYDTVFIGAPVWRLAS